MLHINVGAHFKQEFFHPIITCTATATAFPTAVAPVLKPENIFVQAHPDNATAYIYIGKSDVLANGTKGGYLLSAGSNMNLPGLAHGSYYHIAISGSPKLLITYQRDPL